MTDLLAIVSEIKLSVDWQKTPAVITTAEFITMIISSVRELYNKTGRSSSFSDDMFENGTVDGQTIITTMNVDIGNDEHDFIIYATKIKFFEKVRTQVNNLRGYSTNALSVTHADKPYEYLTNTIQELRQEKNNILRKMVRYMML